MRLKAITVAAMAASLSVGACAAPAASRQNAMETAPPAAAPQGASAVVEPSAALKLRAEDLIKLINGEADAAKIFTPGVLAQVPAERLTAIAGAVRKRYGTALAVGRIEATSSNRGRVFIVFEQTELSLKLGVASAEPNLINELLFA